jgi:glycine oxidase
MKVWDAIVLGGGVIGMSLARELRKQGAEVLVIDRGQPGREASYAAAGMLTPFGAHMPAALRPLASLSAGLFAEFVHELEDESGRAVDLRAFGALVAEEELGEVAGTHKLDPAEMHALEPCLEYRPGMHFISERSVDPRALMAGLLDAAKHRGIHIAHGSAAADVRSRDGCLTVKSERTEYIAQVAVNCCGAWTATIGGGCQLLPVRPVKGQMLSLVAPHRDTLKHLVRTSEVYLVPRTDGRVLVGATVEEAGFDKRVEPDRIQKLHQLAANLVPDLGEARMLEAWAGLRPGTPDDLPVLGETDVAGYFVAAGHFRNGILLAPVTAIAMASMMGGVAPSIDLGPFSPKRFAAQSAAPSGNPALDAPIRFAS